MGGGHQVTQSWRELQSVYHCIPAHQAPPRRSIDTHIIRVHATCLQDVSCNDMVLTSPWLACSPTVPHQDHSCYQVSKGDSSGGLTSADPHLRGPGRQRLPRAELRPGPDSPA